MIAFTLLALFALTGVQSALESTYKCPDNYKEYESEELATQCHQISKTEVTWETAKTECEKHGGYLARIDNQKESEYLYGEAAGDFWIGLNRKNKTDEEFYYSPAPETSYDYTNWLTDPSVWYHIDYPRSRKLLYGDCVFVTEKGKWKNTKCNKDDKKYVCEKDAIKTLECPEGYKFNDKDKEKIDACYKLSDEGVEVDFKTANETCVTEGAHLYFPETKAERDYVNDLVNKTDHWIGINDIDKEETYETSLGGKVKYECWCPTSYVMWWIREDDDDCVVVDFRGFGLWNCFSIRNCAEKHGYVCKMI